MQKLSSVILIILFFALSLNAQEYSSTSRKAIKNYEKALQYLRQRQYSESLDFLIKAQEADNTFVEVYLLRAEIYRTQKKTEDEINSYKKAIEVNPEFYPKVYFFLAEAELKRGEYTQAKTNIELFLNSSVKKDYLIKKAKDLQKRAAFGEYQKQHPVNFSPINLGKAVNTPYNDYWPSLTVDEKQLFTTVRIPDDKKFAKYREDIYVSYNESTFFTDTVDSDWTQAHVLPAPLATKGNEGACSVSADGKILFFTRCTCPNGFEKCCDIYYSVKHATGWSKAQRIPGYVNSGAWEAQPSISSSGTELYFTSNRIGGAGKQDIWKSTLELETGKWGKPINLGDSINTPGNEMSPFIHPDNQTLYFASDYWPGMGGYDLFISRKRNNQWTKPVNLGYPINSHLDESGLIVNSKGTLAYYASDKQEKNNLDIYNFALPEKHRPIPVKYIKGKVIDAKTKKALQAKFSFIDDESARELITSYSDAYSGEFFISLPVNSNYLLNVERTKYLFYSSNFFLKEDKNRLNPLVLTVELVPIELEEIILLKNIFFETASYKLLPKSNFELNKLYELLKNNENILKIEIRGHTDNEGTKEYNQTLSENRAKAVYKYLINKGVDKERLTYKGFGLSKPIADNATKEGRAKNRRTEFKITKIK